MNKAFRITVAEVCWPSFPDRDNVDRRRSHVDEQPFSHMHAGQRRAGVPIGRSYGGCVLRDVALLNKTGAAGVKNSARGIKPSRHNCGEPGDTFLTRGEGIAEFARHGDRVERSPADGGGRFVKGAIEFRDPEPEGAGDLHGSGNHAVFRARGLQMRTSDVPSDNNVLHLSVLYKIPGGRWISYARRCD